jgi:hypothetical protein
MFRRATILTACCAALGLAACAEPGLEPLPQPEPPHGAVSLRVAHAVNPRFERLAPREIDALLAETARVSRAQFGVELKFEPLVELPIDKLFGLIPEYLVGKRSTEIYDFKRGRGDRATLAAANLASVRANPTGFARLSDYVRPYLDRPLREESREALAEALTDTMLARLARWAAVKAPDGAPLLDASPYNEFTYWDSLGYGALAYDLVLTNQPVISAEYDSADIHSALRGGLTVGATSYSRDGRARAYVFWSSFPFLSQSAPAVELRGGRSDARDEAVRLAGAYLAHEIGHLLFRYGHPFGEPACVMNPVPLLRFAEAIARLDAARCAQSARPEMKPGAAPIYYHRGWAQRTERAPQLTRKAEE